MPKQDALPETMQAWRVHQWGENPADALALEELPLPEPEAGEVLVRAQVIPLNLNDLERVNGRNMMARPELPVTPGMEVFGEVVLCGAGAEEWMGRRVVAMPRQATGGYAEFAVCPTVSAFEMPADIELPDAGALYFPYHLAWLGLLDRGSLAPGESVLIHAGAGGSGSAAIQLAKSVGAKVFATAGTDAKVALCRDLGADVAINYQTEDFCEVVLQQTEMTGVDVVFDNVGVSVMEKSMNCIAYNGRYLLMGFASDKSCADEKLIVPRRLATGNFKLCGVLMAYADATMGPLLKQAMGWNFCPEALGSRIMNEIIELLRAGRIRPVVGERAAFTEIPAALTRLRDRQTMGRTLVTVAR